MFNQNARKFIKKVIKQRDMLLHKQLSRKNYLSMENTARQLERYLNNYSYTDLQMAKFFTRHAGKIAKLMPGVGSNSHKSFNTEFHQLLSQAAIIIKINNIRKNLFNRQVTHLCNNSKRGQAKLFQPN